MRQRHLTFVIVTQIIIIFILGFLIINKIKKQKIIVNLINRESVKFVPTKNLNFYYELKESYTTSKQVDGSDRVVYYSTNEDSLNELVNYKTKKPSNTIRIIAMGDSFTYGMNVDTGKSWPDILEKSLNNKSICSVDVKFEVVNLGVPGYDIEYSVERFLNRGLKYDPDLVIWFPTEYERILEKMIPKLKDFKSGNFLKAKWSSAKELGKDNIIKRQQQAVGRLVNAYDGKLMVVKSAFEFLDYDIEFKKAFMKRPSTIYYEEERLWDSLGSSSYLPDGHFSIQGHVLFAEKIYQKLNENKNLLCNGD